MPLILECEEDELSEVQKRMYGSIDKECSNFINKLDTIVQSRGGEVVKKGERVIAYQLESSVPTGSSSTQPLNSTIGRIRPAPASSLLATSPQQTTTAVGTLLSSNPEVILQNETTQSSVTAYKLVMLPTLPGATSMQQSNTTFVMNTPVTNLVVGKPTTAAIKTTSVSNGTPKISVQPKSSPSTTIRSPSVSSKPITTLGRQATSNIAKKPAPVTALTPIKPKPVIAPSTEAQTKTIAAKPQVPSQLSAVVDLTDDESTAPNSASKATASLINNANEADSKEVTIPRFVGKHYPSLTVVARPNTKVRELPTAEMNQERALLDTKVKAVLVNTPSKLTEWLLQKGLVCSEQSCDIHGQELKLGMYSDASKFPFSGGYVWISDCCPNKYVSVFKGSIFENSPFSSVVILKLIYHWACQTGINNVVGWLKVVDTLFIRNFFTLLRAVCIAAVCEKFGKMGGPNKKVEIGVISLGTTSTDGQLRTVKVEVLGVLESDTKFIRMRAIEPVQQTDCKGRFLKILRCVADWVHLDSIIVIDHTVDKATVQHLGFTNVIQTMPNSGPDDSDDNATNNHIVMDYLKRVVPRTFQSTLSYLDTKIIQQFLDELAWRQRFGFIPSRAFDSIIDHLSEQTRLETGDTLINRLQKISMDPFKDWRYSMWKNNCSFETIATAPVESVKKKDYPVRPLIRIAPKVSSVTEQSVSEKAGSTANSSTSNPSRRFFISLENYYYGTLPPDNAVISKLRKADLNMRCTSCRSIFNNNIQFMRHLIGHALNEGAFATDHQCKYCVKNFTSLEEVEDHVSKVHTVSSTLASCLICEEKFENRVSLITHMHSSHNKQELPYQCGICKYRSSEHRKAVDHFYEVHDNGEKVQCPLCLKVVAFENNGRKIPSNVTYYIHHIQRHQKKYTSWKCPTCVLSFVKKAFLKEHQAKDHNTCIMPGVCRDPPSPFDIVMPVPQDIQKDFKKNNKTTHGLQMSNYTTTAFFGHKSRNLGGNSKLCLECGQPAKSTNHFKSYYACMKCMYSTCCGDALFFHMDAVHESKKTRELYEAKNPMYCACGFSSTYPDEAAQHLVLCKHKTLYSSAEKAATCAVPAQSASFPTLVDLDDDDEEGKDVDTTTAKIDKGIGNITSAYSNKRPKLAIEGTEKRDVDSFSALSQTHNKCGTKKGRQPQDRPYWLNRHLSAENVLSTLGLMPRSSSTETSDNAGVDEAKSSDVCETIDVEDSEAIKGQNAEAIDVEDSEAREEQNVEMEHDKDGGSGDRNDNGLSENVNGAEEKQEEGNGEFVEKNEKSTGEVNAEPENDRDDVEIIENDEKQQEQEKKDESSEHTGKETGKEQKSDGNNDDDEVISLDSDASSKDVEEVPNEQDALRDIDNGPQQLGNDAQMETEDSPFNCEMEVQDSSPPTNMDTEDEDNAMTIDLDDN